MKNINTKKEYKFDDVYESLRLNTVHRYFHGTGASLIAVFSLFELLHNLRELVKLSNDGKDSISDFSKTFYRTSLDMIDIGKLLARPEVFEYVFNRKRFSDKAKKRLLDEANKEFLHILKETNIKNFIERILEIEENL
jgi:hypothetical protein